MRKTTALTISLTFTMLAACAAPSPPTPTPFPTATSVPPTPTLAPTGTPVSPTTAPAEEEALWDLVFISDSSGWGVGSKYAKHLESDLGVGVTLHDCSIGTLSAGSVLNYLNDPAGKRYDLTLSRLGLAELLAKAEVVVFYANPVASVSETHPWDWNCISPVAPYVNDCSPETFGTYKVHLHAIYEEILALRGSAPIIIRALDAYNPLYSVWRSHGVFEECKGCWETYNQAIHEVAAEHNVPVARVFDAFNGPNHDEDARDKGYIGSDGIHTTAAGTTVMADALRELGYEKTAP